MGWQLNLPAVWVLISAVLALALGIDTRRQRSNAKTALLAWLLIALSVWGVGYGLQLGAMSLETKLAFSNLGLVGAFSAPSLWLFFALRYTRQDRWVNRNTVLVLAAIPSIMTLLAWSNPLHQLVRVSPALNGDGMFPRLVPDYGVAFWLFLLYALVTLALGAVCLFRHISSDAGAVESANALAPETGESEGWEEDQQQVLDDLRARNVELDAFAHTVAHDLKNPLTRVIGYAEALQILDGRLSADQRQEYIKTIIQGGRKLRDIINELLLLATIRSDQVEMAPLSMGAIVDEVLERLEDMVDEYRAVVTRPDGWPPALGHAPWVEEIWVNYLSNAIKYGGEPPRIELGASVQPAPEGPMVRFWVRDQGNGVPQTVQEQLFAPFGQTQQLNTKGYGLGLSIVERIAARLGGEVGVESTGLEGDGSLFYFTLPMVLPVHAGRSGEVTPD